MLTPKEIRAAIVGRSSKSIIITFLVMLLMYVYTRNNALWMGFGVSAVWMIVSSIEYVRGYINGQDNYWGDYWLSKPNAIEVRAVKKPKVTEVTTRYL